jgi:hypothetical protein
MNTVGQLASGIWEDLGQPANPSVTYISGWLGSDRGVGKLNVQLGKEFIVDISGANAGQTYEAGGYSGVYQPGDFFPALGSVEAAIYAEIYKYDYYDKKIRDALNGILDTTNPELDWQELSEGDTTIRRSNRNEVVKTYRGLQQDSRSELNKLVGYYRQNLSNPSQITTQEPIVIPNRIVLSWNRTHVY